MSLAIPEECSQIFFGPSDKIQQSIQTNRQQTSYSFDPVRYEDNLFTVHGQRAEIPWQVNLWMQVY